MWNKPIDGNTTARRLREILLNYLQAAGISTWPGGDGLTVEDVLDCYPEAVAVAEVPDWQQLLRRHPELDPELHEWLATKDRWVFAFRRQTGRQFAQPWRVEERKMSHRDPEATEKKRIHTGSSRFLGGSRKSGR